MDKRKLIQIIEKELGELKLLTEELSEEENDSGLIAGIALSKAKLLCQEVELLGEFSLKEKEASANEWSGVEETKMEEETADDELPVSDPELEVVSADHPVSAIQEEDVNTEKDESTEEFDDLEEDFNEEDEEKKDDELIDFDHHNDKKQENQEEKPKEEVTSKKSSDYNIINRVKKIESFKSFIPPVIHNRPVLKEIPNPSESEDKEGFPESFHKNSTLNDTISESKQAESTLSSGSISSLRASIGLNDRFLFIREIFGNNTEKYNKMIDHLDKLETIQQAVDYLKANITLQKNEAGLKFVDLLKRRFTK
jgi:hypothetical protein